MTKLPPARLVSSEPSARLVRWMMRATWLVLSAVVILVVIGNHLPPG